MADYEVKTADISRITGVPEKTVRKILREHEDRFTCREIGRVRIYTGGAIETVMDLAGGGAGGEPEEAATGAQRSAGGNDAGGGEDVAHETHAAHAPQPDRHLLGEMSAAIKTMQEMCATQHLQIERLKRALEEEQARTSETLQHLHDKTETLERILREQQEESRLTREWIKYFDEWTDEQSLPLLAKLRRALDTGKR